MPDFLGRTFFDRHHLDVARDLLGTTLVWGRCAGTVVETEAYAETGDPACHLYTRPSTREFFARHPPGTAYIYLNYGVYWLLNVLAGDGILLFRAIEPTRGIPTMQRRRGREKLTDLCSGPGKLGVALDLGRHQHGSPLTGQRTRGILPRDPSHPAPDIVTDTRIGISAGQHLPWRFLVHRNPHVSKPPRPPHKKNRPPHVGGERSKSGGR